MASAGAEHHGPLRVPGRVIHGDLQAGQDLDLLATMIERSCRAHHRRHTADARRYFRIDNVQFRIGRELPLMTLRTQVIGTANLRRTERREQRFGA